jgi:hypothetical protein
VRLSKLDQAVDMILQISDEDFEIAAKAMQTATLAPAQINQC